MIVSYADGRSATLGDILATAVIVSHQNYAAKNNRCRIGRIIVKVGDMAEIARHC